MKILIYSHDTFGLGHLRRARTIANHIAESDPAAEIVIVSGSPLGSAYTYSRRVRVCQIPAVRKQPDGSYRSADGVLSIDQVIDARMEKIAALYEAFVPDLLIVDKEPLGLHREFLPTLERHRQRGGKAVLGLREVLDAPDVLSGEWQRKGVMPYLERLYDEIWIYGPEHFNDPLSAVELSDRVRRRVHFTGFLRRDTNGGENPVPLASQAILVTSGGGGDGFGLMAAACSAAATARGRRYGFVLALGAFMSEAERRELHERAATLDNVTLLDFQADHDLVLADARLVVGMCGYNTFCEVLSADKRALFVPRTHPRREQAIRAMRAGELGWARMIDADEARDGERFVEAMEQALQAEPPSMADVVPQLDGLERISERVQALRVGVAA
ncbi:glycosyltransferase family protein [Mesorhizobium xinjiangense]|uniref:glycosyltransferase family protein n=1 Tax=Mesorhizobium xinjiangense TaxID=2678685 RepID=UPI0012EDDACE|nr:glycosyltransferase [Mesorhizobium xinjiangense]